MDKRTYFLLLLLILVVNFVGLFGDIFCQDSSLYAVISKSFVVSGDYMNIYVSGADWLDKPHFPFWVCALFMEWLGANAFAYKLPSFLFFIVGMIYTYKLGLFLYDKKVAQFSTLILGSAIHIYLSNNDVRAEAILMGLIAGTSYYLFKLRAHASALNILLAALFSAASIMTKGVFVLIIPFSAIFFDMLFKGELRDVFKLRWYIFLALTTLFIFPEIYAVYQQFDLHPEKIVFGRRNVSGVKFVFWDSQFGRFFNTGPIKGKGDPSFYLHTMLWSFAPWAILGYSALFVAGRSIWRKEKLKEYYTFFAFVIMFLIFSISRFQLPHYINILFPFLAILTASFILDNKYPWVDKVKKHSINVFCGIFILLTGILELCFGSSYWIFSVLIGLALVALLVYTQKSKYEHRYFLLGVLSSSLFFLYLNLSFYPRLMTYQAGTNIAKYIDTHYKDDDLLVGYNDFLLQFYSDKKMKRVESLEELKREVLEKNEIIIADDCIYQDLDNYGVDFEILKVFPNFRTTRLSPFFIYPGTRDDVMSYRYLIEVKATK